MSVTAWTSESWKSFPNAHPFAYPINAELERALAQIRQLPPLVAIREVEQLRQFISEAQEGKRFVLQGGDCAETFAECSPPTILRKLKILFQMSLVLMHASNRPVVRIGRLAGQYAKPRTGAEETVAGETMTSYFGDLVNASTPQRAARVPDPSRLLSGYFHSAATLNYVRSQNASSLWDMHPSDEWALKFAKNSHQMQADYEETTERISDSLRFMSVLGERPISDLTRSDFFVSHEALHLPFESSQVSRPVRGEGSYLLSTHFPWLGERTRNHKGAHVEFLRGIENPLGIKIGPTTTRDTLLELLSVLNPRNEPGRITLISRVGDERVFDVLPPLIDGVKASGHRVLWLVDPMHGNTIRSANGTKTRHFDSILREVERSFDAHHASGSFLGGIHIELTGDPVTECVGGSGGLGEDDLPMNYTTTCDPRLNFRQALEISYLISRKMRGVRAHSPHSFPPIASRG